MLLVVQRQTEESSHKKCASGFATLVVRQVADP